MSDIHILMEIQDLYLMKPLMDKRLTNIIKFDLENLQIEIGKTIQGRE